MTKPATLRIKQALVVLCGAGLLFAALAAHAGDIVTYVHTDRLGNPVAKTDSTGAVIWRQSYTPYGETDQQPDPDGPGYTGHRHDAATGLVYMQARYYDPRIGRFLSPDPVTYAPGRAAFFNRYWYASGNPYKYTDPDGRCGAGGICKSLGRAEVAHPAAAARVRPLIAGVAAAGIVEVVTDGAGTSAAAKLLKGAVRAARSVKTAEKAVSKASRIEDVTKPGSKLPNIKTDVSKGKFEKNLGDSGYAKSTSKDGKVNVFTKGDKKYATRNSSKSTKGPTADVSVKDEPVSKIRLKDE